jgi:acetylornithine deacetylase/succinyl-diaminopimelate desuccinylase-like protein
MSRARITRLIVAALLAGSTAEAQRPSAVPVLMQDRAVQAALEHAKSSEPRTIEDQVRFCEVPAPPFKEGARGQLLRRTFMELGLQNVRVDRVGNVLGDRPGQAPRPRLVVAAHLDTVFPEGTPVSVTRQGNVLRGPGIGDNCRGLAALVSVVRSLNAGSVRTAGTVTFVANVGEEGLGDLRGVKALFGETLKGQVDRFVSIDNAGIHVSAVGVGSYRYRVTFKGPGGHSFSQFGLPNPANALGRAIAKIAEFRVGSTPRTTFNVGRIGGGTSVNAIPFDAWMEVDMRSSDPAALNELDGRFKKAVDAAVAEENARWGRGTVTAVKELVGNRPAGQVRDDAPIMQTALAVARALRLPAMQSESSSDSNLPMSMGIPAITIGAGGESYDAHAITEWFDASNAWRGTQNAVLLTIALAEH